MPGQSYIHLTITCSPGHLLARPLAQLLTLYSLACLTTLPAWPPDDSLSQLVTVAISAPQNSKSLLHTVLNVLGTSSLSELTR
ncbi:hypothetical protein L226DRAFT_538842, partial [Lentinus tigrinus ALCF2SS1-7]|uniref:uncharacterized protein n=1 Tax=Lentinus tigrinus ALCF2SS1-7 TaxID=1328758 RepID=UPI001165EF3C